MGREPFMSFASRPSDRPLPRRSILPFKTAIETRDTGADDTGADDNSESLRDASGDSVRAGVARSLPLSDPLPGWPFASNIKPQKCSKVQCSREFISEINLRRHNRSHLNTLIPTRRIGTTHGWLSPRFGKRDHLDTVTPICGSLLLVSAGIVI